MNDCGHTTAMANAIGERAADLIRGRPGPQPRHAQHPLSALDLAEVSE